MLVYFILNFKVNDIHYKYFYIKIFIGTNTSIEALVPTLSIELEVLDLSTEIKLTFSIKVINWDNIIFLIEVKDWVRDSLSRD